MSQKHKLKQITMKRKSVTYHVITDFIGKPEDGITNGCLSEHFKTKKAARLYWQKECRDRKKGDRYDSYWNSLPLYIEKRTVITEILV